jgi:heat shock protein HslJ
MTGIRFPLVILLLAAVSLTACRPANASLSGTQWTLLSLNGQPLLSDTSITAEFSEDQVSGSSGCNQYSGMYEATGSDLSIHQVAATMMYCMEPDGVMDQEGAFFDALASVVGYRMTADRLEMLDASGAAVLVFGKRG